MLGLEMPYCNHHNNHKRKYNAYHNYYLGRMYYRHVLPLCHCNLPLLNPNIWCLAHESKSTQVAKSILLKLHRQVLELYSIQMIHRVLNLVQIFHIHYYYTAQYENYNQNQRIEVECHKKLCKRYNKNN